jgi:type III secretion protein HrpB1
MRTTMDSEDDPKLVASHLVKALKASYGQADQGQAEQGRAPKQPATKAAPGRQKEIDREHDPKLIAPRMVAALKDDRLDEAEAMYDILCKLVPESELLTFRVFLLIQRGRATDALQLISELPDDCCPELKVICLHLLDDPTWYSLAESLEDSPDPAVRKAMRQVLQRPVEAV